MINLNSNCCIIKYCTIVNKKDVNNSRSVHTKNLGFIEYAPGPPFLW